MTARCLCSRTIYGASRTLSGRPRLAISSVSASLEQAWAMSPFTYPLWSPLLLVKSCSISRNASIEETPKDRDKRPLKKPPNLRLWVKPNRPTTKLKNSLKRNKLRERKQNDPLKSQRTQNCSTTIYKLSKRLHGRKSRRNQSWMKRQQRPWSTKMTSSWKSLPKCTWRVRANKRQPMSFVPQVSSSI